jgi:hypothetical protein
MLSVALAASLLLGCPSKEGGQTTPNGPALGQGPLANLEATRPAQEAWTIDGQPAPMLYFAPDDVRVSATCQKGPGPLSCDALRQIRQGAPVEIPRRFLDGRQSPGVKVCTKLGLPTLVGRNPMGSEDSFCRFADGSLVSTGVLERFAMRVME